MNSLKYNNSLIVNINEELKPEYPIYISYAKLIKARTYVRRNLTSTEELNKKACSKI